MTGINPNGCIMACYTERSRKLCGYYLMKHGIRVIGSGLGLRENQMAYLMAAKEIEDTFGFFTWNELRDSMIYAPTYLQPFRGFSKRMGYIAASEFRYGWQATQHLSKAGREVVELFWQQYEEYERYYRELTESQFADYLVLIRSGKKDGVKELRLFHKKYNRQRKHGLERFAAKTTGAVKEQFEVINKSDELNFE